jgi:hypothetical protein
MDTIIQRSKDGKALDPIVVTIAPGEVSIAGVFAVEGADVAARGSMKINSDEALVLGHALLKAGLNTTKE